MNEIRMLLDFVTGSPIQTLRDLVIPNPDVVQSDDNPTVTVRNTGILNRLTLSASGLAFIAGFGVEGVFGMLDSLVRRVFPASQGRSNTVIPG